MTQQKDIQVSDKDVMKLALEALVGLNMPMGIGQAESRNKAITALRQAIEQEEQEVTSLQCAHCQVTIDTLNDKVMYLMEQAQKEADERSEVEPVAEEREAIAVWLEKECDEQYLADRVRARGIK